MVKKKKMIVKKENMANYVEQQILDDAEHGNTECLYEILMLLTEEQLFNCLSDKNQLLFNEKEEE